MKQKALRTVILLFAVLILSLPPVSGMASAHNLARDAGFYAIIDPGEVSLGPGGNTTALLTISNPTADNISLTISLPATPWWLNITAPGEVNAPAGGNTSVPLPISVWRNITTKVEHTLAVKVSNKVTGQNVTLNLTVVAEAVLSLKAEYTGGGEYLYRNSVERLGFNISNRGNIDDSVLINITGPDFVHLEYPSSVYVPAGGNVTLMALVNVSHAATLGEFDITFRCAYLWSLLYSEMYVFTTRTVTLTVREDNRVTISSPTSVSVVLDESTYVFLNITSRNAAPVTASVTLDGEVPDMSSGWVVDVFPESVSISAGKSSQVALAVSAPTSDFAVEKGINISRFTLRPVITWSFTGGDNGTFVVYGNPVNVSLNVVDRLIVPSSPSPKTEAAEPGGEVAFTLRIRNIYDKPVSGTVSLKDTPGGWSYTLSGHYNTRAATNITISAGGIYTLIIDIKVPNGTLAGTYGMTVEIATETRVYNSSLSVIVNQTHSFNFNIAEKNISGPSGGTVSIPVALTNTGNGNDTFLILPMEQYRAYINTESTLLHLSPGETARFNITVEISGVVEEDGSAIFLVQSYLEPAEFSIVSLHITSLIPDLVIEKALIDESSSVLSVVVRNNGTYKAANITVSVMVNGKESTAVIGDLEVGESSRLDIPVKLSTGKNIISVRVDPSGRISELSEENNEAVLSYTVEDNTGHIIGVEMLGVIIALVVILLISGGFLLWFRMLVRP